jgi:hypothetical protein
MSRRAKWYMAVGVAVALLILLITVALFSFMKLPAPTVLPISFLSFTNSAAGMSNAIFLITNPYPRKVNFCVVLPQVRSGSGWPQEIAFPPAVVGVGLAGHRFTNFSVTVPSNGSWRVPVLAVFEPTRVERWRALVKVNWRVYRETGEVPGLTGYGISGWTNFSQEFNPEMRR